MLSYWKYSRTRASVQKLWPKGLSFYGNVKWSLSSPSFTTSFIFPVIPDIFYRESILVFWGWKSDDNYKHDDRCSLRLGPISQYHWALSIHLFHRNVLYMKLSKDGSSGQSSIIPQPDRHSVLLLVDPQNDFFPGGAMGMPTKGNNLIPVINAYIKHFSRQ